MTDNAQPPEQSQPGKPGILDLVKAFASSDAFEEAKLTFYVSILTSFLALLVCHWLGEMGALASLLTGMWTGFGVLIGKIGWGKNQ